MSKVLKAVFPVAGLGSRFLPATKSIPKEMLPIVDKPLIQYAVEEAIDAGINQIIFITGRNKRAIEDHFDKAFELEWELENRGKKCLLDQVRITSARNVSFVYIRQSEALGLGHAILQAKPIIGKEDPFAVVLADDLISSNPGTLKQMVNIYNSEKNSVIAAQYVDKNETESYGILELDQKIENRITSIVEKPKPDLAPSNLGVVGRYIFNATIFDELTDLPAGAGGEIQLTDGIASLLKKERVLAYKFDGKRYDCGSKLGYLQANVEYGLKRSDLGEEFTQFIKNLQI